MALRRRVLRPLLLCHNLVHGVTCMRLTEDTTIRQVPWSQGLVLDTSEDRLYLVNGHIVRHCALDGSDCREVGFLISSHHHPITIPSYHHNVMIYHHHPSPPHHHTPSTSYQNLFTSSSSTPQPHPASHHCCKAIRSTTTHTTQILLPSQHPFTLSISPSYLFWSDWKSQQVLCCSKRVCNEAKVLHQSFEVPKNIKYIDPSRNNSGALSFDPLPILT